MVDNNNCDNNTEEHPCKDLFARVAQQFLEMVHLTEASFLEEFLDHLIQDNRLMAGGSTYAGGVKHGDCCKEEGKYRNRGIKTVCHADGGEERTDRTRMGTWHATRAQKISKVELTRFRKTKKHLDRLRNAPA